MRAFLALAVLLAVATSPAHGDGTLSGAETPYNTTGATLDGVTSGMTNIVNALQPFTGPLPPHAQVEWNATTRTLALWTDSDGDGERNASETHATFAPLYAASGNGTDVIDVWLLDTLRVRACTGNALVGLDGFARGLRCDGDIDGDGEFDIGEILLLQNPLRPGAGDSDNLLP